MLDVTAGTWPARRPARPASYSVENGVENALHIGMLGSACAYAPRPAPPSAWGLQLVVWGSSSGYGYGHNGPHREPAAPCRGGCGSTRPRDCDASRAISTSPRPRGLLHFSHPCSRCADDGNTRVCGEPAHCAWRVRTQLGLSAPSHTTIGRWCGGAGQSGRILISRHLVQHHTGGG